MGANKEQLQAINSNADRILCLAGAGAGKALKNGTKVKTPIGDVAIEHLHIGDLVFASDGNAYPVLGVFPQGKKSVVRITFSDRNYIDCCEDHLWIYQTRSMRVHHKGFDVKTTKELTQIPLKRKSGDGFANNLYIPMCNSCSYPHQEVPIDPYFLGLLLGDGGLSGEGVKIHNIESDILAYVECVIAQYDCHLVKYADCTYSISKNKSGWYYNNKLLSIIRDLGINCRSVDKFIPDIYKYNDVETRLALLQGLIDTDGHVSKSMYELSTASERLALDIVEIAESLGLTCVVVARGSHYINDGQRVDLNHNNYRIFIKPSKLFPKLHRSIKHDAQRLSGGNQNYARRYVTSIEYLGIDAEMTCISVDSPDHSFLTEHYIVTHNTTVMIERISRLVNAGVAPSSILALTFTNAAAAEMKERFETKNPGKETPEFRTFHSFCYSIICKDPLIREALGYSNIPTIASDEQIKELEEKAKTQCKITLSKEKLKNRDKLTKQEQYQVALYDKALDRLMRSANVITFDKLNSAVANLFALGNPATQIYKDKYKYIHVDECLPACMSVFTDNGWYKIDRLYSDFVAKKSLPLVKSYNIETSEYEYKPIIGVLKSENREIFEVHTEGLNKIQCTSNHKFYTQRGYVEAKDLIIGQDMIILDSPDKQKTKYLLNEDQYQICLGSYLGDGHIERRSKFYTYRLNFTQGIKQQEYFMSKIAAFGLSCHAIKSGYTQETSVLQTYPTPIFALNNDIFNCVLSDISPLGLAVWYQDDGSLNSGKYVVIHSNSFNAEDTNKLLYMLKTRFDINATRCFSNKGYYYLRLDAKNSRAFLKIVSPYMHPSMQYKTIYDISNNKINYNSAYLNIGANFIDKITYIGTGTVYDLTVADNHNFITAKSSHRVDHKTGTIVHNCQDTDKIQMSFLNSFTDSNFYFCGDTLQNLYSFRGTSNEYIKALANTPGWEKIRLFTNYRSTNQICEYANKFSKKYADASYRIEMQGIRDGERVHTILVDGPTKYNPINLDDVDNVLSELETLTGTSAILCRTNKEVDTITFYLKNKGIEFTTGKDTKVQHLIECAVSDTYMIGWLASYLSSNKYGEYIRLSTQVKNPDLNWFLKLYGNTPQIKEDVKIINQIKDISTDFGFTNTKLDEVAALLHLQSIEHTDKEYFGKEFLQYLKDKISDIKSSELYVGTIHSVKGLEYDNVFVMNVGSYNFRLNTEDEKNLFYVAVTRAKKMLFVYELFDS